MMLSAFVVLIFTCLLVPMKSFSLAFSDIVDQTAIGPMLIEKPKHVYTPAIGIGSRVTGLEINETGSMKTTNRNNYLIGLDVDGSNTTLSIPFRDPKQSTDSRVDSKLVYASTSLILTPHIRADASYDFTRGYLVEDSTVDRNPLYLFPDLSYEKMEMSLSWISNPKHDSFLFSPIMYKRAETSSAWILSASIARYHLASIGSIQKYELFNRKSTLSYASIYSLSPGIAYSSTRFYKNWFIGGVLGANYDFNYFQKNYTDKPLQDDSVVTGSATINISSGYSWDHLTTGVFITIRSWNIILDDYIVRNSHGKSGWYFSYTF